MAIGQVQVFVVISPEFPGKIVLSICEKSLTCCTFWGDGRPHVGANWVSSGGKGALTPLTKILRTFLGAKLGVCQKC